MRINNAKRSLIHLITQQMLSKCLTKCWFPTCYLRLQGVDFEFLLGASSVDFDRHKNPRSRPAPVNNLLRTAVSDCKLAMLDAAGFHNLAQRFMRRSEGALKIVQYANLLLEAIVKMLQVIGH